MQVGVKNRLKSILNYKKPAFWVIIVAAIACVAVTVVFLTDPLKANKESETKTDTDQQDRLMEFLEFEFMDHNKIEFYEGSWFAVDCEILETKESDDEITVYLWGMFRIYSYENGLKVESNVHIPVIITAQERGADYVLSDYWQPRAGSDFENDVKSKFPEHLQSKALDSQQYVKAQAERCDAEALEYYSSVYIYHDGSEIDEPTVRLDRSEQEAGFNYSVFASVGVHGKYELTDTELTITDVNTGKKYVFKVDGNNLVFDASKSAEIHKYDGVNKVPDGAVFEPLAVK